MIIQLLYLFLPIIFSNEDSHYLNIIRNSLVVSHCPHIYAFKVLSQFLQRYLYCTPNDYRYLGEAMSMEFIVCPTGVRIINELLCQHRSQHNSTDVSE
jgi:hypothetical protein